MIATLLKLLLKITVKSLGLVERGIRKLSFVSILKKDHGITVYFDGVKFASILVMLSTIFGEYVRQGTSGVTYIQ